MAQCRQKAILLRPFLIKSYWSVIGIASNTSLKSVFHRYYASSNKVDEDGLLNACDNLTKSLAFKDSSTCIKPAKLGWEGSSHAILLEKLENVLKDHQVDEAWETYKDFKRLYGFPEDSIMRQLITEFSYSLDSTWLCRAFDIVLSMSKEKSALPRLDVLTKLCLSLARAQMPSPTSVILRLMLQKNCFPPLDILGSVFLHMVKTEMGAILAANILTEICDLYEQLNESKSNFAKMIKPDTMLFNLILDACIRYQSSLKGQQIIELMAEVGVVADAHTIVIIAQIYEMNCMRDELKKYKRHIDVVSASLVSHYRQFYDSMLSLHFIFNDIDAASALIKDMYQHGESNPAREARKESCTIPIGSPNLKMGLKLHILPELLQKDTVIKVEGKPKLVLSKNGKLVLSSNAVTKLMREYKRCERINELSTLLNYIQSKLGSSDSHNLCHDVIDACIHLGWLQTAHDILDDLESEGSSLGQGSYVSLLTAYYNRKMFEEGDALVKQIRKAGMLTNLYNEMAIPRHGLEWEDESTLNFEKVRVAGKSDLVEAIIHDIKKEAKSIPPSTVIHELNSSIYFFMKAKMIGDAMKTYRRMQEMKIQPTVLTFAYLIGGYSSLGMYREITILWGDIKRNLEKSNSMVHRDLYESLLLNFIRGGYFERVLEVIAFMTQNRMYLDKWVCKCEFLKFHKDLYRSLKASNARNEVQMKRLEHVRAFRNWIRIN
ncbi:pentatricopeptide repeat-containing protein At4g17616 [Coffea eugenioides]|uniref:pentatricopeptide repeat-containing protein At4g17616 n=1 Tax=Coffea eugenioides TaxID=49369 RepID=UPI000F606E15|nr:pentatricopeptide repeat-containing protein At4g17616 [Coffea eugenioides]